MQDMLNSRKRGDMAFRDKDFKTAIDCYTQVSFFPFDDVRPPKFIQLSIEYKVSKARCL